MFESTTNVMLDIETLGLNPDAVVLSVGAVKFDTFGVLDDPFTMRLSPEPQVAAGRTIDPSTLRWWFEQSREVQQASMGLGGFTPVVFMAALAGWINDPDAYIWARGPQFDIVILENLFRMFGHSAPWKYNRIRDCRTFVNSFPLAPLPATTGVAHNALDDARQQALEVVAVWKYLKDAGLE